MQWDLSEAAQQAMPFLKQTFFARFLKDSVERIYNHFYPEGQEQSRENDQGNGKKHSGISGLGGIGRRFQNQAVVGTLFWRIHGQYRTGDVPA